MYLQPQYISTNSHNFTIKFNKRNTIRISTLLSLPHVCVKSCKAYVNRGFFNFFYRKLTVIIIKDIIIKKNLRINAPDLLIVYFTTKVEIKPWQAVMNAIIFLVLVR